MINCIDCGKLLSIHASYYKYKRCTSCAMKFLFKNKKNHPRYKKNRQKFYCIDCNKILGGHAVYCKTKRCNLCHRKFLLKNPKNHPTYIDGRSYIDYPPEFNDTLKYKIRERDNFECQNCYMTEEEHIIVWGQVLHIHHVDYNKFNLMDINLISLCCSCNLRANKNREFWKLHYQELIQKIYATIN